MAKAKSAKWGARYTEWPYVPGKSKWKTLNQFRKAGRVKVPGGWRWKWKFWRNEFPSEAVAEHVLGKLTDKKDAEGKPLYIGHTFEIKPKPEPATSAPLFYKPDEWGSIGVAPGYTGQRVDLSGGYMVPHYGAIGNVKGPRTRASEQALVRAFEKHHRFGNDWPGGLGYHAAVAQSGRAYMSVRGMRRLRGAHTGNAKNRPGDPNSHLGIVLLVGDNEAPSPAAIAKVERLRRHFGANTVVRYHREFDWTSCAGTVIPRHIKSR